MRKSKGIIGVYTPNKKVIDSDIPIHYFYFRVFKDKLFKKFLDLLGVSQRRPGLEYLTEIVNNHIARIPFENISKLYYRSKDNLSDLVEFEIYLDGIERYSFGGTCYANNYYLNYLLNWLGYEVKLCGAAMKSPDVHLVNLVNIEERDYLVDVGFASPFASPLPLVPEKETELKWGTDQYRLRPSTAEGGWQLEHYRNGSRIHGYGINPAGREIGEFRQVIRDSFLDESEFMKNILLTRMDKGIFCRIHNLSLTESNKTTARTRPLESFENLAETIESRFGILGHITRESICANDNLQHLIK